MSTVNMVCNMDSNLIVSYTRLANGLKVYVIPNTGCGEVKIDIVVKYGGIDKLYKDRISGKVKSIKEGIAHYIEHLMFYEENRTEKEIFEIFDNLNAEVNAFTSMSWTKYSVVAYDDYVNPLRKLMKTVFVPYFSKETLEKERKVVSSEIEITKETNSILNLVYSKGKDLSVIGTKENLRDVTVEELYNIYENYYTPNNMAIVVSGDVETVEVIEEVEAMLEKLDIEKKPRVNKRKVKRQLLTKHLLVEEINQNEVPVLQLATKLNKIDIDDIPKLKVALSIFQSMNLNCISEFSLSLLDNAEIEGYFDCSYLQDKNMICYFVETYNPFEIKDKLVSYLKNFSVDNMTSDDFEIVKRAIYKDIIQEYILSIHDIVVDSFVDNSNIFEFIDVLNEITFDEYKRLVKKIINFDDNIYVYCKK